MESTPAEPATGDAPLSPTQVPPTSERPQRKRTLTEKGEALARDNKRDALVSNIKQLVKLLKHANADFRQGLLTAVSTRSYIDELKSRNTVVTALYDDCLAMQVEVTEDEHTRYQCLLKESSDLLAQLCASLESHRAETKSVRSHVTAHSKKSHSRRSRSSRSSHRSDKLAEAEIELASAVISKQKHKSKLKLQMLMEEVETDAAIAIAEKKVEILSKHNNSQDLSSDEDVTSRDAPLILVPRNSAQGHRAASDPVDADTVSRKLETIQAERTRHVELSAPIPLDLKESDESWETLNAFSSEHASPAAAASAFIHFAQTTALKSGVESQSHVATSTRDTAPRPASLTHTLGFSEHHTAAAQTATHAPSLFSDQGFSLFSQGIEAASPRLSLQNSSADLNTRAATHIAPAIRSQTISLFAAPRAAVTATTGNALLRAQLPSSPIRATNTRSPISGITTQQLASALASAASPRLTAAAVAHPSIPRSTAPSWTASLRVPPISRIATVTSGVSRHVTTANITQNTGLPITHASNALFTSAPLTRATPASLTHAATVLAQTAPAQSLHAVSSLAQVAPASLLHATSALAQANPASLQGATSLTQAASRSNYAAFSPTPAIPASVQGISIAQAARSSHAVFTLAQAIPAASVQGASSLAPAASVIAPRVASTVSHAAPASLAYAAPTFPQLNANQPASIPLVSHSHASNAYGHAAIAAPVATLPPASLCAHAVTHSNNISSGIPAATSFAFADETLPLPASLKHYTATQAPVMATVPPAYQHFTPPDALAPRAQPPPTEAGFLAEYLGQLSLALMNQINLSRAPSAEPAVFTGENPLDFPEWLSNFEGLITTRGIPATERMRYLQKYTDGPAKEAIKGFFWLPPEQAFENSFAILKERYNDPFYLACTYRETLGSWPKVGNSDSAALRRFVDFLKQLATAKFIISDLSILDDEVENRKIAEKLPDWLRLRWNRISHRAKKTSGSFPSFVDFVAFLVEEDGIANAPLAKKSVDGADKSKADHSQSKPKGRSLATKQKTQSVPATAAQQQPVASVDQTQATQPASVPAISLSTSTHSAAASKKPDSASKPDKKPPYCYFCKENHFISQCESLVAAPVDKRKEFLKTHQRCHSCLSTKHKAKDCRFPRTCVHCKEKHHSAFHDIDLNSLRTDDKPADTATTMSTNIYQLAETTFTACLPVRVRHLDSSGSFTCYALLDNQSNASYVLSECCKSLGVKGKPCSLTIDTLSGRNHTFDCERMYGLEIAPLSVDKSEPIRCAYTKDFIAPRDVLPTPDFIKEFDHLTAIASELHPPLDLPVGLLLGVNCFNLLEATEVIPNHNTGLFAQKTALGWCVMGSSLHIPSQSLVFKTQSKEIISSSNILNVLESDFIEKENGSKTLSFEDKRFLDLMESKVSQDENMHYVLPLPVRDASLLFDNSKEVLKRFTSLSNRLQRNTDLFNEYQRFMNEMLDNHYAELVPDQSASTNTPTWYIPHFDVHNKGKIRVVHDCSAKYKGISLNDTLINGPDLVNTLFGVLCRFRQNSVAFTCDVAKMFLQFRVPPSQRDLLRFFWFKNPPSTNEVAAYRMCVHLFGAGSSPAVATWGLRRCAKDNAATHGTDVEDFITRNFYVDDGLKSIDSAAAAIDLIRRTREVCAKGSLKLHKFNSNSLEVLTALNENTDQPIQCIDPDSVEKVLGVFWTPNSDTFTFRINLKEKPLTRRGILSTVGSLYDPLGFSAPFSLVGKLLLQELCRSKCDWDEPVSSEIANTWKKWTVEVPKLADVAVPRCFLPTGWNWNTVHAQLHHFSDGSTLGYGYCSYLRLKHTDGHVHVSFIAGKARVAPLSYTTIPRLELQGAVVSANMSRTLSAELELELEHVFWTDSQVVLGYIRTDTKRFHVYVANRVAQIRSITKPSQWHHVAGKDNPADIASRGATTVSALENSTWFDGPAFLKEPDITYPTDTESISLDDPEVKASSLSTAALAFNPFLDLIARFSKFNKARSFIAVMTKLVRYIRFKQKPEPLIVSDYVAAELTMARMVQGKHFPLFFSKSKSFAVPTDMQKLDPFVAEDGLVRVGGRFRRMKQPDVPPHPIIIPKSSFLATLLVRYAHSSVYHQGRTTTLNRLRTMGYWITGMNQLVKAIIRKCVICLRFRGLNQNQKMADLPAERLEQSSPFDYTGMDFFGPFEIKEGRKTLKRYGVVFTCLYSRAIHLEAAIALSTDAFLNALRRFLSTRGPVRLLRCDQGTNFVGVGKQLDLDKVKQHLVSQACDFEIHFNPPASPHRGGVWERMVGSVKRILEVMLLQSGSQLDDDSFRTLLAEIMYLINSRPLAIQNLTDSSCTDPITPNHLLTMKKRVLLPPPSAFVKEDIYSIKRWRRVQYMVNVFWSKFRADYMAYLTSRSKWTAPSPNLKPGDVVLVKQESPRAQWPLARIIEAEQDSDGLVRQCKLRMPGHNKFLQRPVQKLVLLIPVDPAREMD